MGTCSRMRHPEVLIPNNQSYFTHPATQELPPTGVSTEVEITVPMPPACQVIADWLRIPGGQLVSAEEETQRLLFSIVLPIIPQRELGVDLELGAHWHPS